MYTKPIAYQIFKIGFDRSRQCLKIDFEDFNETVAILKGSHWKKIQCCSFAQFISTETLLCLTHLSKVLFLSTEDESSVIKTVLSKMAAK